MEINGMGSVADYIAEGKIIVLEGTVIPKIQNKMCRLKTLQEEYQQVLRKFQAARPTCSWSPLKEGRVERHRKK